MEKNESKSLPASALRLIAERISMAGEKYIARSRWEYLKMTLASGGAGLLTAGTTVLKFLIGGSASSLLFETTLVSLNYAGSFLLMQVFGFKLATKHCSMLAAALAGKITKIRGGLELANEATRVARSLMTAALGNVGLVVPTALAFDWLHRQMWGKNYLTEQTSHYVLHSLDPFGSCTITAAMVTGVLLWLSTLFSGWVESRAALRKTYSQKALRRIGGISANVSIGVLLAVTPALGKLLSIPLDIRHVTLSSGSLALSVSALGWHEAMSAGLINAVLGVLSIGALNFGVSFTISFLFSVRASGVSREWALRLFGSPQAAGQAAS